MESLNSFSEMARSVTQTSKSRIRRAINTCLHEGSNDQKSTRETYWSIERTFEGHVEQLFYCEKPKTSQGRANEKHECLKKSYNFLCDRFGVGSGLVQAGSGAFPLIFRV